MTTVFSDHYAQRMTSSSEACLGPLRPFHGLRMEEMPDRSTSLACPVSNQILPGFLFSVNLVVILLVTRLNFMGPVELDYAFFEAPAKVHWQVEWYPGFQGRRLDNVQGVRQNSDRSWLVPHEQTNNSQSPPWSPVTLQKRLRTSFETCLLSYFFQSHLISLFPTSSQTASPVNNSATNQISKQPPRCLSSRESSPLSCASPSWRSPA